MKKKFKSCKGCPTKDIAECLNEFGSLLCLKYLPRKGKKLINIKYSDDDLRKLEHEFVVKRYVQEKRLERLDSKDSEQAKRFILSGIRKEEEFKNLSLERIGALIKEYEEETGKTFFKEGINLEDLETNIDEVGRILDESHKEFEALCEGEIKIFGKTTYETYKEYMLDGIRSGKYPELQEEGF